MTPGRRSCAAGSTSSAATASPSRPSSSPSARLDEDGEFAGANGSVRDMRERDRLERELRESEARFRHLVQTTPDVIYRCDADGRFLFMAEGVRGAVRLDAGRGRRA